MEKYPQDFKILLSSWSSKAKDAKQEQLLQQTPEKRKESVVSFL